MADSWHAASTYLYKGMSGSFPSVLRVRQHCCSWDLGSFQSWFKMNSCRNQPKHWVACFRATRNKAHGDDNTRAYLQSWEEADVHESMNIFQVLVNVQGCNKCWKTNREMSNSFIFTRNSKSWTWLIFINLFYLITHIRVPTWRNRTELGSSARTVYALNCWAISWP